MNWPIAFALACLNIAVLSGCTQKSAATPQEIERLVAAALRRHDAGPPATAPGARTGADPTGRATANRADVAEFGCLSTEGQTKAQGTATMFLQLQDLMSDFVAPEPEIPPEPPERCLTTIAAQNDPMAAQIERGLESEVREQRRIARAAAEETRANFLDTVRPVAWTWVRVWVEGQTLRLRPEISGCQVCVRDDGYHCTRWVVSSSRSDCGSDWRVSQQAVVASREPELSQRVRRSGNVHPEGDLYCVVKQAVIDGDFAKLTCQGPRADEEFRLEVPAAVGAAGAALAAVGVGDLVRVQNHLVITREFARRNEEEDGTWVVRDVPVENVSLVETSTCCHPQNADAGVAPAAAP